LVNRDRHIFFTLAVIFDAVFVSAAWLLCYVVRFRLGLPQAADASTRLTVFVKILPIIVLCDLIALGFLRLYRPARTPSVFRERVQVAKGAVLGWLGMLAALYYYTANPYSRVLLFIFLFVNPLALMGSRTVLRVVLRGLRRRGWSVKHAAIVGTGRLAQKIHDGLKADPWMGVQVDYFVKESSQKKRRQIRGVPVRGSIPTLLRVMREHPVDSVFVAVPMGKAGQFEGVLDELAKLPVTVAVVPDFRGVVTMNTSVDELNGLPVIQLVDTPIQGWYAVAKRTIDVVGSLGLLAIFGLPMLGIALLVKLTSRGPVLFRQVRMGLGGRPFSIMKFRSMRVDAEADTGPVWAKREDPRCTPLGAFLRRTSLDELPQLINVLVGDMSLVGPRPERPHFVEEFVQTVPAYMLRHNVKAGLTGWAQINGLRGDTSLKKRLQYDLYYVNNWSLGFDLFILLRTPFTGFLNKNAH